MILATVPLAFTGVAVGLALSSGSPLSLYTLYGVIALTGIVVNSAIVLIDAANERLKARHERAARPDLGRPAARGADPDHHQHDHRRPVLAGLRHRRHSLLWGPVAGAIVWGLGVATVLTLFVMPVLYIACMTGAVRRKGGFARPAARYN
jgi:multidrug efflux pump subunit AcrB